MSEDDPGLPLSSRPPARRAPALNQGGMRSQNLSVVLGQVRAGEPVSRAQLAALTGLTKPGITKLVADLVERGLLRDGDTVPAPGRGRPSVMVHVDGSALAFVAAELNVRTLRVRLLDFAGRELFRDDASFAGSASARAVLRSLMQMLDRAIDAEPARGRYVAGVGLAVAGLVGNGSGRLVTAPGLGWRDVDVVGVLSKGLHRRGVPLLVDNVARLGALAEARLTGLGDARSIVRIEAATGIGAGIVLHGELERGVSGYAGAIGHITVTSRGPRCLCGRTGCLEAMAGIPALVRAAAPDLAVETSRRSPTPAQQVQEVARRVEDGDRQAVQGVRRTATWLGRGVATIVSLLDPEHVVLGGYPLLLRDVVLPVVEAEVDAHVVAPDRGGTQLRTSALGDEAALLGAAEACRRRVLDDPTVVPPRHT